ncbi:MAG: hypothetical protein CMP89_02920 [Gammaproteobacteria bacterium]|nr:hypothetical protein [Gammaproteobacteria bacterium]HCC42760.1 hypothetical protein [Gammaproteobacteria bacterium]
MTAELRTTWPDIDIALVPEGKGIFDVKVDQRLIYSKYMTGRFPKSNEITNLIKGIER